MDRVEKLNFNTNVKTENTKANKCIGIIRKLADVLPRKSLAIIFKSFI